MSVPIFSPNETGEQVNEVRLLSLEAAKKLGLSLPIESYDPSKHHPLCKSGRDLEKSLHPVIPGMAHAIANQTAAVERYAVQANDAKDAAYEELTGNIKSHLALAVLIHERQPEYLRRLEALEQERSPKREVFAQNAAHLEIALDPKTISVASVTEALRGEEDYGSRTVPIPGAPSRAGVVGLALTKVFAPLFLGIPIGLALVTLTGMIPIATLQNLDDLTAANRIAVGLFWMIGVALDHVLIGTASKIAKLHARVKFEAHIPSLPSQVSLRAAALWGTAGLVFLCVAASLLEGYGLYQMSLELAFMDNSQAPPFWIFLVIGSVINGAILLFASYVSFTASCRELAEKWPWKQEVNLRPALGDEEIEARKALMKAACELIDLNTKVSQLEAKLRADQMALAEKPQVSALALQRIAKAEAEVDREAIRLRKLLEYVSRRMGVLPPFVDMGELPTKMILLPFQKTWLYLRGQQQDRWPDD